MRSGLALGVSECDIEPDAEQSEYILLNLALSSRTPCLNVSGVSLLQHI